MLRNYLRVTLRNIARHRGFSFINIVGLATGMAAFILITLFIQNELSFDKHHEKRNDVYRVVLDAVVGPQTILTANSPSVMAGRFIEDFPEVVGATRIDDFGADLLITVDDQPFYEPNFFLADSSVFSIFTLPFVTGNPATALNRPNTVVLAESIARKYFGDADPIGKVIRWDNREDLEVTGVMVDPIRTSHFQPDLLGSFLTSDAWDEPTWINNSYLTYLQLADGADPAALEAKFPDYQLSTVGPDLQQFMGMGLEEAREHGFKYDWKLEVLSDIYLYSRASDQSGPSGDIRYLYVLGLIAVFVLLIACINFMNLSTAKATGRAREVGVRKVLGSERSQLIGQFLGESTILAIISMAIGFALVVLVLPFFENLAGMSLQIAPWLVGVMLLTALVTGLVAGLYPAFVLSSFRPVVVLKGSFSRSRQGTTLRSALVVFQFAITIALLVGTAVVYKQLQFIQNQDLGFDEAQVVVVPIETSEGVESFETFRSELLAESSIINAAAAGILPGPGRIHSTNGFNAEGTREDQVFLGGRGEVSNDYVETLGLTMVAGRDFDPAFPADSSAWLINESMAAQIGWSAEEAVGKMLSEMQEEGPREGIIIGVVADAHYTSLHQAIQPLAFGHWQSNQQYVPIRIRGGDIQATLGFIEEQWTKFEPGYPFRYFFMDEDYARFYERERRLGSLYSYFTLLAIIISCLGLFGLASFVTTQRTREIGVRKAMGASAGSIVVLLSREFTLLVFIACLVGFPVAWFAMSRWLEEFAYATNIGWAVFALAAVAALLVAWSTVGYQSVKAALSDPVRALRYE